MTVRTQIRSTDTGTVTLRYEDQSGEIVTREFWVPTLSSGEGYVREVTSDRPGTLGRQVCVGLDYTGSTLTSSPEGLIALIRDEWKRARAAERREQARW